MTNIPIFFSQKTNAQDNAYETDANIDELKYEYEYEENCLSYQFVIGLIIFHFSSFPQRLRSINFCHYLLT